MPDPRTTGLHRVGAEPAQTLTFLIDNSTITFDKTQVGGSAVVGRAVQLVAAGTVALTLDGGRVLGKLIQVETNLVCSVQCMGVVQLPGGDAPPAFGNRIVGATLSGVRGYIRAPAATGAAYAEAAADDQAAAGHRVLDAAVSTAIEVALSHG
jgi:hypothetical protein